MSSCSAATSSLHKAPGGDGAQRVSTWRRCWFGCKMLSLLLLPPHCSIPHLQPAVHSLWFLRWRLELGASQRGVKAAGLMQSALLYLCLVGMGTVLSLHKVSAGPVPVLAMVAVWMEALSMFSTQRGCTELSGRSRKHLGHQACAGRRCIAVCHGCDVFIRNQGREAFFFPLSWPDKLT